MRIPRIPALAFARPADVPDLFDQVAMDLLLTPEIGELVDYFERTYIGRTVASGYHVAATYDILTTSLASHQPKRRRSQQSEEALKTLVHEYYSPDRSKMEFLQGVAHYFSLGAD
ncbi:hypothetical protein LOD99_12443 [Oopsacas minuta]|uniref:Uncharacterized protein n=1 Tax=Oopsacas minuta TaxID=111878 RepID=A0AAV7JF53_9METZ|nr:hypothetical protein LOD99_12443 [Oopsacas minuta]